MQFQQTEAVKAYKAHVEQIPEEKWTKKVRRALISLGLIAGVVAAVRAGLDIPWQVYVATIFVAGYIFSPDVMVAALKFLVGAIRDILGAIKNGKS